MVSNDSNSCGLFRPTFCVLREPDAIGFAFERKESDGAEFAFAAIFESEGTTFRVFVIGRTGGMSGSCGMFCRDKAGLVPRLTLVTIA